MRRREFVILLGGTAVAWPLAAHAQQGERMRRVGVLMNLTADDPETSARVTAFAQGLQQLGWTDGRNVRIDYRWSAGDADRSRKYAAELVALAPDVILANGSPAVVSLSGKWLELLKEIAPSVTRVAVLRDAALSVGPVQFGVIQAVAPSFRVEVNPINLRDAGEIERAIAAFAGSPNGGLILTGGATSLLHSDLIITLAARHKLPAVYPYRHIVTGGGLIFYGANFYDQYRRAAGYVDRILKGEKPADLPVQAPTKYELVINLKTAKTLGLEVPATLLARADEVIE